MRVRAYARVCVSVLQRGEERSAAIITDIRVNIRFIIVVVIEVIRRKGVEACFIIFIAGSDKLN